MHQSITRYKNMQERSTWLKVRRNFFDFQKKSRCRNRKQIENKIWKNKNSILGSGKISALTRLYFKISELKEMIVNYFGTHFSIVFFIIDINSYQSFNFIYYALVETWKHITYKLMVWKECDVNYDVVMLFMMLWC